MCLSADLLAPEGYGEIIGGGQRSDNLEYLEAQLEKHKLPREPYEWYLDLRKYGSVPHCGFWFGRGADGGVDLQVGPRARDDSLSEDDGQDLSVGTEQHEKRRRFPVGKRRRFFCRFAG